MANRDKNAIQTMRWDYANKRKQAIHLYKHYMTVTWTEAGIRIDSDNIAEWEDVVDRIIDAAVAKGRLENATR